MAGFKVTDKHRKDFKLLRQQFIRDQSNLWEDMLDEYAGKNGLTDDEVDVLYEDYLERLADETLEHLDRPAAEA